MFKTFNRIFKYSPISKCKKKEDLIEILYVFHNQVNKNLRKPEFHEENLETYKSNDITEKLNIFIKSYSMRLPSALMNLSFRRSQVIKKIKDFFLKILNYLNNKIITYDLPTLYTYLTYQTPYDHLLL